MNSNDEKEALKKDYVAALNADDTTTARHISKQMQHIKALLGEKPVMYADVEYTMHQLEAEHDYQQTLKDERNKYLAREQMETM